MSDQREIEFRLGDWLVQPSLNQLSRPGKSVLLEPKSMEVLVYLCRNPGKVVSADEIIDAVWNARPMGENPVYKSIAKLRRALHDDAGQPRYIATVAKKGYRLVAQVEPVAADRRRASDRQPAQPVSRVWLPIGIGLLAGVVLATAMFWRPQPEHAELQSISVFRGSHQQPAFAPDGTAIAFVNQVDGATNIWVLGFDDSRAWQLTAGDSPDSRPRWSPDGQTILFGRNGGLWSIPAAGGNAQEVVRGAYNPNWSPDGRRIVFERSFEVWMANADGSDQQRVPGIPRKELPLAPRWPAFSPTGEEIVYLDANFTPFADLWRVRVNGGTPIRITAEPAIASAPVWTPDGLHIIYSTQRGGSRTLWKVDVDDGSAQPLLTGSGDDDYPDVSHDGRQLVYSNRRERFRLLRSLPGAGREETLLESRQLVLAPELSPDGSKIAYFAMVPDGGVQLFTMPITGGSPKQHSSDPLATHAIPRWSADGEALYYYFTRDGASFNRIDLASAESEVVVDGWDWGETNGASVSPDGQTIAYSRLAGHVPVQTMLHNRQSRSERSFYATLEYPRWSADGSKIAGARHVDQRFPGDIVVCRITATECWIVAQGARIPMWSADESELYYVRGFGRSQKLFAAPATGAPAEREVMAMEPLFPLGPFFDVAEDGSIIWVRHEEEPSEIWLTTF